MFVLSSISLLASVVGVPSSPTNISTPTYRTLFLVSRGKHCWEGCGVWGLGAIVGGGGAYGEGGWVGRGGEWAEERRGVWSREKSGAVKLEYEMVV